MFDLLRRMPMLSLGWFFDKDGGAGASAEDKPDDSPEDKSDDKSEESKAGGEKPEPKDEKKFSQADLEAIVDDRLKRERKKSEAAAEKARKDAEAAALEKNQEWQKLAEARAGEIAALTQERDQLQTYKDQAEKYKAALDGQLAKVKESLPKHLLPLIDPLDPVDAMQYITDHAKELGAKPLPYGETPEHKEKRVSTDDEKNARRASSGVVTRNF